VVEKFELEPVGFDAQFNMGVAKLYRLHDLLRQAHNSRTSDEHSVWKAALDGIRSEIKSYLDPKKDGLNEINLIKKKCELRIIQFAKWSGSNIQGNMKAHIAQSKQIEMENCLDEYEVLLVTAMKNRQFDMPDKGGNRNVTHID